MASLGSIKVQHILWDSDKDPFGFNQWLSEFSDMVRALKGGEVLELFLDEKLKRLMRHASMVSKILLDDGDFLNEEVTKALAEAKSSSASIVTTTKTLGEATVKYSDFSAEVVTLDKQLYSVMRQCIKGSRKAIIENVVVHSYVQAVCVFHQHINLSASDRKIRALESLSTLKYTGDTHLFQIESTKRIKELMDSRCQMEDWILFSLMKAFGHSNENIQYRLAEKINEDREPGTMNIFDLITEYMGMVQCVGQGKSKGLGINQIQDEQVCNYCGKTGPNFKLHKQHSSP